ncbi:hypothetical protein AAIR98_001785 [Elusimicrobium simillimum]
MYTSMRRTAKPNSLMLMGNTKSLADSKKTAERI